MIELSSTVTPASPSMVFHVSLFGRHCTSTEGNESASSLLDTILPLSLSHMGLLDRCEGVPVERVRLAKQTKQTTYGGADYHPGRGSFAYLKSVEPL